MGGSWIEVNADLREFSQDSGGVGSKLLGGFSKEGGGGAGLGFLVKELIEEAFDIGKALIGPLFVVKEPFRWGFDSVLAGVKPSWDESPSDTVWQTSNQSESKRQPIERVSVPAVTDAERNDCGEYESPEWWAEKRRRDAVKKQKCGVLKTCRRQQLVSLRDANGQVSEASILLRIADLFACGEARREVDKCYPPDTGHTQAQKDINNGIEECYDAVELVRRGLDPTKASSWP
jgi:hypothetical protein